MAQYLKRLAASSQAVVPRHVVWDKNDLSGVRRRFTRGLRTPHFDLADIEQVIDRWEGSLVSRTAFLELLIAEALAYDRQQVASKLKCHVK
jgi:hypothetical protein